MSRAAPSAAHQAGLAAALVVVRLVLALLNTWLADLADLPSTHPDRRLHARLIAQLTRAEAQILADIAAEARIARFLETFKKDGTRITENLDF